MALTLASKSDAVTDLVEVSRVGQANSSGSWYPFEIGLAD